MNEIISTRKAFERLIMVDYYWALTGLPKYQRNYYRMILKSGKRNVTIDKMEELLTKAGFLVKKETVWALPDPYRKPPASHQ